MYTEISNLKIEVATNRGVITECLVIGVPVIASHTKKDLV